MSQLPSCFDPFILQDQLIKTLKNSQITQQFTSIRANQILESIILKPIVIQYKNQIKLLKEQLKAQHNQQRTLKTHSKQTNNQLQKQLQKKQNQVGHLLITNNQLQQQLRLSQKQKDNLHELLSQKTHLIQKLSADVQQKEEQIHQTTIKIMECQKVNEELMQIIKERQSQIQGLNSQINMKLAQFEQNLKNQQVLQRQKQQQHMKIHKQLSHEIQQKQKQYTKSIQASLKQIQKLKEERFEIKNELNSYKIDYEQLIQKKLSLQGLNNELKIQIQRGKDNFKNFKNSTDKERKLINNRLYQLTSYYKKYQLAKKKLKNIAKVAKDVKNQYNIFVRNTADQLRKLYLDSQNIVKQILDELGQKVSKDLQVLNSKLQQSTQDAKISKAQTKLKQDMIQRLERQLSNQNKETNDLKNQTRIRKRQEQRLRRQLRKNFQQNEIKLSLMERKYLDLLNGMPY